MACHTINGAAEVGGNVANEMQNLLYNAMYPGHYTPQGSGVGNTSNDGAFGNMQYGKFVRMHFKMVC
jgi:hypothetical protein